MTAVGGDLAALCRILDALREAMDYDRPDLSAIQPEALGVSRTRWLRYMEMLSEAGRVAGVCVTRTAGGAVMVGEPRITLAGLEALEGDPLMRRELRAARGIRDTITGA